MVRVSQSPKTPLQSALLQVEQGQYYAARTGEVLGKAERALDGFVGAAMNISLDNEERSVSRQGQELSLKVRKGDRYLKRSEVNQAAYNKSLTAATESLELALQQATHKRESEALCLHRQELSQALSDLALVSSDSQVEDRIGSVKTQLTEHAQSRLNEVEQDVPGRNVSEHGRPVWNIFENSIVELGSTQGLANRERASLGAILDDLRLVESRAPSSLPSA